MKVAVQDAESAAATSPLTELEVPGAWEELELQLFASDPSVTGVAKTFAFRGGELWGELAGGFAGLRSALVEGGELFYTYSTGSGVMRAHIVRLSLVSCELSQLQSGGYSRSGALDLFLRLEAGAIIAESGSFIEFNQWSDGELYGRLVNAEASLTLVDATGASIEPMFPPP